MLPKYTAKKVESSIQHAVPEPVENEWVDHGALMLDWARAAHAAVRGMFMRVWVDVKVALREIGIVRRIFLKDAIVVILNVNGLLLFVEGLSAR